MTCRLPEWDFVFILISLSISEQIEYWLISKEEEDGCDNKNDS